MFFSHGWTLLNSGGILEGNLCPRGIRRPLGGAFFESHVATIREADQWKFQCVGFDGATWRHVRRLRFAASSHQLQSMPSRIRQDSLRFLPYHEHLSHQVVFVRCWIINRVGSFFNTMASEFTASCLTTGQEFILDQLKPVVLAFRCGEGAQKLQAELDLFGPCPRPEV